MSSFMYDGVSVTAYAADKQIPELRHCQCITPDILGMISRNSRQGSEKRKP